MGYALARQNGVLSFGAPADDPTVTSSTRSVCHTNCLRDRHDDKEASGTGTVLSLYSNLHSAQKIDGSALTLAGRTARAK